MIVLDKDDKKKFCCETLTLKNKSLIEFIRWEMLTVFGKYSLLNLFVRF
jgi:hypothetical protein